MKQISNGGSRSFSLHLLRDRFFSISTLLNFVWALALWWGERHVFERSVSLCYWDNWETWQPSAHPHHVLLVADPQLVDPHTYPDRPWPLSTLTVMYTDLYLRRSYKYLQDYLRPDSTLFLGDLFDGGREWATVRTVSAEARYKNIGTKFWLKEYFRFSNIFLRSWFYGSPASLSAPMGRRIIASVPGNHDLGFANGIQMEVKDRFDAFFGPLNRVDVIGNHSIVSLNTVSLSAMDAINPLTGSSGNGDGSAADSTSRMIWKPVEDFLMDAKTIRNGAVEREFQNMRSRKGERSSGHASPKLQHEAVPILGRSPPTEVQPEPRDFRPSIPSAKFPTVVLSHVPLYRADGANCGPMREHGTSIPLSAGYQYQNVLTPMISSDIVKHLTSEEIVMIYSGDDHDYCEIDHTEFTGRIKEITVKSMSWAMGIRKPGVQLVSLYNPIDLDYNTPVDKLPTSTPQNTIQNHLCLLPDQLSIFIHYAQMFGLTLVVLIIHALRHKSTPSNHYGQLNKDEPLLPVVFNSSIFDRTHSISQTSSSAAAAAAAMAGPDHQSHQNRFLGRKLGAYGHLPPMSRSTSPRTPSLEIADPFAEQHGKTGSTVGHLHDDDDWSTSTHRKPKRQSKFGVFLQNLWRVAWPVLLVYFWLVWNG